jgi:hypothetical protein
LANRVDRPRISTPEAWSTSPLADTTIGVINVAESLMILGEHVKRQFHGQRPVGCGSTLPVRSERDDHLGTQCVSALRIREQIDQHVSEQVVVAGKHLVGSTMTS